MQATHHEVTVFIEGHTWGGFFGEMEYKIQASRVGDFKELKDFKSIAGDFETITKAELIEAEVVTNYKVTIFD